MQSSSVVKQSHGGEYSIGLSIDEEIYWLDNSNIYEFYIIEDLYSYMLTGSLTFIDSRNLFEFSHITGDISVTILTGVDDEISYTLNVFRANRVIPSSPNQNGSKNVIQLSLAKFNFRYLISQRYSYSWSNTRITDIVSDIIKNMLYFDSTQYSILDQSDEKIDFVMPYWTPFQALNWLLLRCSSDGKLGYCCYTKTTDDVRGSDIIEVQTLQSMLNQTKLSDDANEGIYKMSSLQPYDFGRILSYEISGIDMVSMKQLRGGHVTGFNFETKNFIDEKFQYSEGTNYFNPNKNSGKSVADKFTMLGDWTLLAGTEYSYLNDTEVNLQMTGESDPQIINNIYMNDWFKRYCVQNTINITVRGHESRELGKLIYLEWPSSVNDEVYNVNMDGAYLVKSITHYFDPKGSPTYRQKLGLIKNAYNYETLSERYSYPSKKKNNIDTPLITET